MGSKARNCRQCGEALPANSRADKKYCSAVCRVKHAKMARAGMSAGGQVTIPEHIKTMRRLAFEDMNDEVREVLREEIRGVITQHVRDNVLGVTEVMTGMLPKAAAALAEDLSSEDEIVRSRAYGLVFKYSMPLLDEKGKDADLGKITVIHEIPVPTDTPFGRSMADAADYDMDKAPERPLLGDGSPEPAVEDFERDWPKCHYCHLRKHPEAMRSESAGQGVPPRHVCSSCRARMSYQKGSRDLSASDPLFG